MGLLRRRREPRAQPALPLRAVAVRDGNGPWRIRRKLGTCPLPDDPLDGGENGGGVGVRGGGEEYGGYTTFRLDDRATAGAGPLYGEGQPTAWSTYVATDDAEDGVPLCACGFPLKSGVILFGFAYWREIRREEAAKRAMEQATAGTGVQVSQTADNRLRMEIPSDISFDINSAAIKPNMRSVLDLLHVNARTSFAVGNIS